MEEADYIRLCQAGDIDALEPIFRRHVDRAVRTAFLITRDWATAEDAVQEAFIRVFRSIRRFRADRPFAPWLYRIVINEARRAVRRKGREMSLSEAGATAGEAFGASRGARGADHGVEGPERRLEGRDEVWRSILGLPEGQRLVVVLKYLHGLTEAETARLLRIPPGLVKSRLYAARQKLRKTLEETRRDQD